MKKSHTNKEPSSSLHLLRSPLPHQSVAFLQNKFGRKWVFVRLAVPFNTPAIAWRVLWGGQAGSKMPPTPPNPATVQLRS